MTGHDFFQEGKTSLLQNIKRQVDCLFSVWGYFLKSKDTWCDCHILAVMEAQSVSKTVTFGSPAPSETPYKRDPNWSKSVQNPLFLITLCRTLTLAVLHFNNQIFQTPHCVFLAYCWSYFPSKTFAAAPLLPTQSHTNQGQLGANVACPTHVAWFDIRIHVLFQKCYSSCKRK